MEPSELLEKDEILRKIEQRRHRSTFRLFLEHPLKTMDEHPYVFYVITVLFFGGLGAFLIYAGANPAQVIVFSLLMAIMPAGFFDLRKRARIRVMEGEFPSLLRDIALAVKSGMSPESAVKLTASGHYGKLTPAVRHIDYLMSWGVSFEEALLYLPKKCPAPLVRRSISTIIEAAKTGGDIASIMENVATDAQELKQLETKRNAETQPYLMVVYVSFFVFLMVVLILIQFFIPTMQEVSKQIEGRDIPGIAFRVSGEDVMRFKELFFHGLIIQGFFAGVVAGKIGGGTFLAGLKHSAVFVTIAAIAYVALF